MAKRKIKSTGDNSALRPRGGTLGSRSRMQSIEMQVQVQVKSSLPGEKRKETAHRQIGSANYKMVAPLNSDKQESREWQKVKQREGEEGRGAGAMQISRGGRAGARGSSSTDNIVKAPPLLLQLFGH